MNNEIDNLAKTPPKSVNCAPSKSHCLSVVFTVVVFAYFAAAQRAAQAAPISGYTFTTTAASFDSTASATVGFRFQTSQSIFVTQLGVVDSGNPGLNSAHDVGIWTDSGTLLATVTVPAGGVAPLIDGFRFSDIPPLPLDANQVYRVGAVFILGNGDNVIEAPSSVGTAGIMLLDPGLALSASGAVLSFPTQLSGPQAATANFRFAGGGTGGPTNGYITAALRSDCTGPPPPPSLGQTAVGPDYVIMTVANGDPMDIDAARRLATDEIFASLMPLYCALPRGTGPGCVTDQVQWNILTYDANGKPAVLACAASGCDSHACSEFSVLASLECVLNDLRTLRATATLKQDRKELDDAIRELTQALDPSLWIDADHLQPKYGEKSFEETEDTVHELRELLKSKKSAIPGATLQDLIDRLLLSDRLLAQTAITDGVASAGKLEEIRDANRELGKGDQDVTKGNYDDGLDHYRHAWEEAIEARKPIAARQP